MDQLTGLSADEVRRRTAAGQTNTTRLPTSRPLFDIIRANVLTPFNALLGALFVLQLAFGSPADALFGFVLVINTAIGIVQELRAKATLDRLAVLIAPRAHVLREGAVEEIATDDIVIGDTVVVSLGDQIVADGTILRAEGLEVDESLLTGESVPVTKEPDDAVLSGSAVIAGAGTYQATAVGQMAYANRLAAEGRTFSRFPSDLQDGINRILRVMGIVIVPVGVLVIVSQVRRAVGLANAVTGTVAALVGMIPEGLVLLTTIAFALGALRLARRQALVQELPAVEGLARVDVMCMDKTGTLTKPSPTFSRLEPVGDAGPTALTALAALVAADPARNATARAISEALPPPDGWTPTTVVPFSSSRRWSAVRFAEHGTWVLGAPEGIEAEGAGLPQGVDARISELTAERARVLLLAHSTAELREDALPAGLQVSGLVVLEECLRPDAAETVRYFSEQGVAVKLISGDAPATVAAIARAAGVPGAEDPGAVVDARSLPTGAALDETVERAVVFGRVSPEQKREIIESLQRQGHVVAMTGDGVNDLLALKRAEIGVAMGSGTAAAKAVAQIVLLDGRFSTMPHAVAEGRRVTANTELVANLFVTKTVWATFLALVTALFALGYPFLPRHITLAGSVAIGIPAFFMALAPNARLYVPGFLHRVTRFALPCGIVIVIAVLACFFGMQAAGAGIEEARTVTTALLAMCGLRVIFVLERPLQGWRLWLLVGMFALVATALTLPLSQRFFAFVPLVTVPRGALGVAVVVAVGAWFALGLGQSWAYREGPA